MSARQRRACTILPTRLCLTTRRRPYNKAICSCGAGASASNSFEITRCGIEKDAACSSPDFAPHLVPMWVEGLPPQRVESAPSGLAVSAFSELTDQGFGIDRNPSASLSAPLDPAEQHKILFLSQSVRGLYLKSGRLKIIKSRLLRS